MDKRVKTAVFAGGCFWCVESAFTKLPKVIDIESGYTEDGREAVCVTYDPLDTDFEKLARHFFASIDPVDSGGQFHDRGHAYTTAIYYGDEEERAVARQVKEDVEQECGRAVATEIVPRGEFARAEEFHQEYAKKNPERYEAYYKGSGREAFFKKKGDEI